MSNVERLDGTCGSDNGRMKHGARGTACLEWFANGFQIIVVWRTVWVGGTCETVYGVRRAGSVRYD